MRTLTDTVRMAVVIVLCTMASAISQTVPEIIGGWHFTAKSISNAGPGKPSQILFKNSDVGATIHLHGKGYSGYLVSSTDDAPQGPVVVMHKSRGSPNALRTVRRGDSLGSLNFKATAADGGRQLNGADFRCVVATAAPSLTDMHTRCRLSITGPQSSTTRPAAEWDPAKGMLLYGRQVATQTGHPVIRTYTRAQVRAREAFPRPAGQLIVVVDDPLHRGVAWSDGRFWRYLDGKVVR